MSPAARVEHTPEQCRSNAKRAATVRERLGQAQRSPLQRRAISQIDRPDARGIMQGTVSHNIGPQAHSASRVGRVQPAA